MRTLLREADVIRSVARYLEKRHYKVKVVRGAYERGTDITATSPKNTLYVEAKGQTSSKSHTERFGKEFTKNQKEDSIGRALLKSLQYLSAGKTAGIALPADEVNLGLVSSIRPALERLRVIVFLVSQNRTVQVGVGKLPS